jgi:hypothetical protein
MPGHAIASIGKVWVALVFGEKISATPDLQSYSNPAFWNQQVCRYKKQKRRLRHSPHGKTRNRRFQCD